MERGVWRGITKTSFGRGRTCHGVAIARSRGFTLLELMITVVIIGVLATMAVYGVSNYIQITKSAEARENLGAMMAGQEHVFEEAFRYLDVTGGMGNGDFYPDTGFDGTLLVNWDRPADGCMGNDIRGNPTPCKMNFDTLGVNPTAGVRFRYASTLMDAGDLPPVPAFVNGFNPNAVQATRPGYTIVAVSDLKPGGRMSIVVGTSMLANLYSENIGD